MENSKIRILLLTPYSGSNIGDGSIQESMIASIKKRYSDAEIIGLTLAPHRTAILHNISCFRLSGISLPFYATETGQDGSRTPNDPSSKQNATSHTDGPEPLADRLTVYKRVAANPTAQFLVRPLRFAKRALSEALIEFRHIRDAWTMCKSADALLISGGGQIDDEWGGPWGHPYSLLKWSILARTSGCPVLFASVGYCGLRSIISRVFCRYALKSARYVSFRDHQSLSAAQETLGVSGSMVVPDLAVAYPTPNRKPRSRGSVKRVAINPISYMSPENWPQKDATQYEQYVSALSEFAVDLIERDYELTFFTTDAADWRTLDRVKQIVETSSRDAAKHTTYCKAQRVEDVLGALDGIDYVVASRLHAVILSHTCGLPVVALSFDPKVTDHMSNLSQSDNCLDIHGIEFSQIVQATKALEVRLVEVATMVREGISNYRQIVEQQTDVMLDHIEGRRRQTGLVYVEG